MNESLSAFRHPCHNYQIFNMLNNFGQEWMFPSSVRAWKAIASANVTFTHALSTVIFAIQCKMAAAYGMFDSSSGVEDKEMLLLPFLLRLRRRRLKAAKSTTWTKCGISDGLHRELQILSVSWMLKMLSSFGSIVDWIKPFSINDFGLLTLYQLSRFVPPSSSKV